MAKSARITRTWNEPNKTASEIMSKSKELSAADDVRPFGIGETPDDIREAMADVEDSS
jgi:hypothetical protein